MTLSSTQLQSLALSSVPSMSEEDKEARRQYLKDSRRRSAKDRLVAIFGKYAVYKRYRRKQVGWQYNRALGKSIPQTVISHTEFWVLELNKEWQAKRVLDVLTGLQDADPDVWSIRDRKIEWKECVGAIDVSENAKRHFQIINPNTMKPLSWNKSYDDVSFDSLSFPERPPSLLAIMERRACVYAQWLSKSDKNPMRNHPWKPQRVARQASKGSSRNTTKPQPQPSAQTD